MRYSRMVVIAALAAAVGFGWVRASAGEQDAAEGKAPAKAPLVTGDWVGIWGPYEAPAGVAADSTPSAGKKLKHAVARLECKVVGPSEGRFQATFSGECGRPYKYTIQVPGRTVGKVVLFQGSADLGEKDGGVYDWIGRATETEFIGFYTSQGHIGHFRLTRPQP